MISIDACTDIQKQLNFLTFVAGLYLVDLGVRYAMPLVGAVVNPQRAQAMRVAASVVDLTTALGGIGAGLAKEAEGMVPMAAQLMQQLARQAQAGAAPGPAAISRPPAGSDGEEEGERPAENAAGDPRLGRFMEQAQRS